MSDLEFLDGQSPAPIDAPVAEPVNDGPARGPDGKFTAAQPEAAPVAEPAPVAAAEPVKPEPGHVPLSALMDERDKRKAAEERAAALEGQQPAPEPAYLDPDTQNAILQTRLNISEEMARDKYTDEVVDAAKAWAIERFKASPSWQQEVLAKPNAYKFVVEAHKEHQRLEATRDVDLTELEAFQAWKAAQAAGLAHPAPAQPAAAAHTPAAPPAPPRSLASATAAGGNVTTTPSGSGVAFDNVITR